MAIEDAVSCRTGERRKEAYIFVCNVKCLKTCVSGSTVNVAELSYDLFLKTGLTDPAMGLVSSDTCHYLIRINDVVVCHYG